LYAGLTSPPARAEWDHPHLHAHGCPPPIRNALRCAQSRRRGDAAADSCAFGRGRTDGLRPHRHPAPIPTAHLAPSAAARRGRLGRAFPRRLVAFFRLAERDGAAKLARELIARLDPDDAMLSRDRERLAAVRAQRATAAQNYFRQRAAQW